MALPEGVLAYRVLKRANLTKEQEQLAKATIGNITYKAMCEKLKTFSETASTQIKHLGRKQFISNKNRSTVAMVVSTVAMDVSIEKKRHTTTIHHTLGMGNSVEVKEELHSGQDEVVLAKEVQGFF